MTVYKNRLDNPDEWFWPFVDKSEQHQGCWIWTGRRRMGKYGQTDFNGSKSLQAHRVAWMLTYGTPIPEELYACHRCDNPGCVNPSHLFLGTQKDNINDAAKKGRLVLPLRKDKPQTHCQNGHELFGNNLKVAKNGNRSCRACAQERDKRRYWANK